MINEIEAMIHDGICTYEVCKLAKEKGFREKVFAFYDCEGDLAYTVSEYRGSSINEILFDKNKPNPIGAEYTSAPTQSLLQRWLREEKWLHINIDYNHPNKSWTPTIIRMCCIPTRDTPYRLDLPSSSSYEVALEKALIYALNMLPSRETSQ